MKSYWFFLLFVSGIFIILINWFYGNPQYEYLEKYVTNQSDLEYNAQDFKKSNKIDYYAIFTTNKNLNYAFPMTISVLCWKRLGIDSIVMLMGTEKEWEQIPVYAYILKSLKEIGAKITFLSQNSNPRPKNLWNQIFTNDVKIPEFSLAQISRIYAAMLPFTSELNNQSTFITTDADLLVFSKNPHIPNLDKEETIIAYQWVNIRFGFIFGLGLKYKYEVEFFSSPNTKSPKKASLI
uniref:Uncharacterized protein n=1 Tax=Acrobeloides nanus TaxID=290746 RepID=A0A914DV07_9BILA